MYSNKASIYFYGNHLIYVNFVGIIAKKNSNLQAVHYNYVHAIYGDIAVPISYPQ